MNIPIGNIVSVSELQKDYRKVINKAKKTNKPILIMRGNDPEVIVIDVKVMNDINERLEDLETEETLRAIEIAEKEFKTSKLKVLKPGNLAKLASIK